MISNWREELREVVDEIEPKAEKKVKETKGISNKIVINPKLDEAVKELGGELLEVTETDKKEEPKEDPSLKQKEKMASQMKKRVLLQKLRAVRSTGGADIMASYEPEIDSAIEYFYEEGINEEGIDLIIEEIGLEGFVDFIEGSAVELNEERAARKASVRAKKFDVVKKEVDKADAARKKAKKGEYAPSYAKKETDVTVYDDKPTAKKKVPAKKTVVKKAAPKPAPKKVAPKPVAKKVETAVAKVKKTQPLKKPSKQGLGDKIRSAYKAGVKRHRKATQGARVFGKGFASGAKKAVKFAKDVKKVVSEEELLEKDLNAAERRALPNKDFVFPGKGEGPEGKQRGAYPINDKKHARAALAMAAAHASPEKEAKVKAAVKKKFPDIQQEENALEKRAKENEKARKFLKKDAKDSGYTDIALKASMSKGAGVSESVMKFVKDRIGKKKPEKKAEKATDAGARAKRALARKVHAKYVSGSEDNVPDDIREGGYQPEIEHSKLGDAKKKADKERESKLPPHLQGDAIGKMKKAFASEAVKGQDREARREMAAERRTKGNPANQEGDPSKRLTAAQGRRSVKRVRYRYNEGEDKAFNYVVSKLKKKYGDGVLTKGDKIKPPTAAQKKAAAAHRAKVDRENAAEFKKDPSQGRYPPGYSNRGSD